MGRRLRALAVLAALLLTACAANQAAPGAAHMGIARTEGAGQQPELETKQSAKALNGQMAWAAMDQIGVTTIYDAEDYPIPYPGGDVPIERGACTDVVVRALRRCGVDLQVLIHEDMSAHFDEYPNPWGRPAPNTDFDHRYVVNIDAFLRRHGKDLPITRDPADYQPGDIVAWRFGENVYHIGIVSPLKSEQSGRYLIVHNAGLGVQTEDMLFDFPIMGRYRYF